MNLAGKTVLITGGRRLGAHLAAALAQRGANLAFTFFQQREPIAEGAAVCEGYGVRTLLHQADLRQPEQAEQVIQKVVDTFGRLDILVNLTSTYRPTPLDELTVSDYRSELASNLDAPYFTALAAAKKMRQQPLEGGLQGKILHFVDWATERPYRHFLPYLVAKGGLTTLTKALAAELAPTITVNAIAPGTMLPPPTVSPQRIDEIAAASALKRIGSPQDITNAALFLLEGTDFVTGEIYRVDGGRFLGAADWNPSDGE